MANQYFTCVLDAWRDGKTLYGRMHYYRSGSYFYQDSSFPNPTMNLGGTTYTDTDFGNRVRSGIYVGDVYSTTFSRTVAGTGDRTVTWSAGSGGRSDFAGTWSKTVNFPVEYTAPTGLNISLVEIYPDGAKMNVSITSYGNPSSASDRYLEAQICVANDYSSTRKYKHGTHGASSLSQQITVTNTDYTGGGLNIVANTQYYYAGYANNTQKQTSKIQGQFVTTAYAPILAIKETGSDYAIIEYSLKADGGYYGKNVQYSLDNGTTWVTGATINSSSATTGTFTINNLNADTSYHLKTRVSTASGETAGNDLSFNTFQDIKFYGSVNDQTTTIDKLYFSRNKKTKVVKRLYGPAPYNKIESISGVVDTSDPAYVGNVTDFDGTIFWNKIKSDYSTLVAFLDQYNLWITDIEVSYDDRTGFWVVGLLFNDDDTWYLEDSTGSTTLAQLGITANMTTSGSDIITTTCTFSTTYKSKLIYQA